MLQIRFPTVKKLRWLKRMMCNKPLLFSVLSSKNAFPLLILSVVFEAVAIRSCIFSCLFYLLKKPALENHGIMLENCPQVRSRATHVTAFFRHLTGSIY